MKNSGPCICGHDIDQWHEDDGCLALVGPGEYPMCECTLTVYQARYVVGLARTEVFAKLAADYTTLRCRECWEFNYVLVPSAETVCDHCGNALL